MDNFNAPDFPYSMLPYAPARSYPRPVTNPFASQPKMQTVRLINTISTEIKGVATAEQMRFAREVLMNTPMDGVDGTSYRDVKGWLAEEATKAQIKADKEKAARAEALKKVLKEANERAAQRKLRDDIGNEVFRALAGSDRRSVVDAVKAVLAGFDVTVGVKA